MKISCLKDYNLDSQLIAFNKKDESFRLFDKKEISTVDRIQSFFGCGKLANYSLNFDDVADGLQLAWTDDLKNTEVGEKVLLITNKILCKRLYLRESAYKVFNLYTKISDEKEISVFLHATNSSALKGAHSVHIPQNSYSSDLLNALVVGKKYGAPCVRDREYDMPQCVKSEEKKLPVIYSFDREGPQAVNLSGFFIRHFW